MINSGDLITQADMDALATLANAKLSPATPYEFAKFDATILPPTAITGVVVPGTGYNGSDAILIIRVYSYNTVAGRNIFSSKYTIGWVAFDGSPDSFDVQWSWTPPAVAPTGYIAVSSVFRFDFQKFHWELTTGFTDDNTTNDTIVDTSHTWTIPNDTFIENPVCNGTWRRELLRMRVDLLLTHNAAMSAVGDNAFVSGPWCLAVGPELLPPITSDISYNGRKDLYFYFADDDAPSGIQIEGNSEASISVAYSILAGTHTYPLTIEALKSGHITIVLTGFSGYLSVSCAQSFIYDSVAGILTIDIDASPGSYDCSLTIGSPGSGATGFAGTLTATTDAVTGILGADGLHPSSAVSKSANLDSIKGIFATSPDSTLEEVWLTISETNGVDGVWVAKTLPMWGVMTFVSQDLPQYWTGNVANGQSINIPTDRLPAPDVNNVDGSNAIAGNNRSALWPVFRDTDFGRWRDEKFVGDQRPIPFWSLDPFHTFFSRTVTLAPNTTSELFSISIPANANDWKVRLETSNLTIYVKQNDIPDPDVPGSYDFSAAGGFNLSDHGPIADWQSTAAFFVIRNDTLAAETFHLRQFFALRDAGDVYPGDTPVFFPTDTDGNPSLETFSYGLDFSSANPVGASPGLMYRLPVPRKGYCIYEVIVRRAPVDNGNGLTQAPATGTADLEVTLGLMRNTQYGDPGTFTALETFTIPAGQAQVRATVFWPVLGGAPLVYQCAEAVQAFPLVNFQPLASVALEVNADPRLSTFSGPQHVARFTSDEPRSRGFVLLQFTDYTMAPRYFLLPVCVPIYNDMEAGLNLLP